MSNETNMLEKYPLIKQARVVIKSREDFFWKTTHLILLEVHPIYCFSVNMNSAHALFFFNFNSLEKGRRIISDSNQEKGRRRRRSFGVEKTVAKTLTTSLDWTETKEILLFREKKKKLLRLWFNSEESCYLDTMS